MAMATEVTTSSATSVARAERAARVRPVTARKAEAANGIAPLDILQSLAELESDPITLQSNGLADALLNWLAPRQPAPGTLAQARIVPLLGAAADLLARGQALAPEIRDLGAAAVEQELRLQRALANRRASLNGAGA
jgi:hypothetical protein